MNGHGEVEDSFRYILKIGTILKRMVSFSLREIFSRREPRVLDEQEDIPGTSEEIEIS